MSESFVLPKGRDGYLWNVARNALSKDGNKPTDKEILGYTQQIAEANGIKLDGSNKGADNTKLQAGTTIRLPELAARAPTAAEIQSGTGERAGNLAREAERKSRERMPGGGVTIEQTQGHVRTAANEVTTLDREKKTLTAERNNLPRTGAEEKRRDIDARLKTLDEQRDAAVTTRDAMRGVLEQRTEGEANRIMRGPEQHWTHARNISREIGPRALSARTPDASLDKQSLDGLKRKVDGLIDTRKGLREERATLTRERNNLARTGQTDRRERIDERFAAIDREDVGLRDELNRVGPAYYQRAHAAYDEARGRSRQLREDLVLASMGQASEY